MAIRVYGVRNVGKVMEGMWEILAVEKAHSYMILGPNYSRMKCTPLFRQIRLELSDRI